MSTFRPKSAIHSEARLKQTHLLRINVYSQYTLTAKRHLFLFEKRIKNIIPDVAEFGYNEQFSTHPGCLL